jgi:hypothetical protein
MAIEKLYDTWASRNPQWETRYEDLIRNICDYGKGETSLREARSKLFGAGYELYIIAFFIGLYSNQRRPLTEDNTKRKNFGWAIENWGNIEKRNNRRQYPKIREYIFAALIARTNLDFIALEKDEITLRKAVDMLITTMEEYANYGFRFIKEKTEDNPNWLFNNEKALLEVFLGFDSEEAEDEEDDEPEEL